MKKLLRQSFKSQRTHPTQEKETIVVPDLHIDPKKER